MPTYRVPHDDEDEVSDSESESPYLCQIASTLPPTKSFSLPKPTAKALFVVKRRKSLRQLSRRQKRGSRLNSQDMDDRHFSLHEEEKPDVVEEVGIDKERLEVWKSPHQAANGSKLHHDRRSVTEIVNAPWSDDEEYEYPVKPSPHPVDDLRNLESAQFRSSSTAQNNVSHSSNAASLPRQLSADNAILPTPALRVAYDSVRAPKTETWMSIRCPDEIFFKRQGAEHTSMASQSEVSHDHVGCQQHSFTTSSSRTFGKIHDGEEYEEGLVIDASMLNLFNGWDLLDYRHYLWRIEDNLTTETRRNNTWLVDGSSVKLLPFDDYIKDNALRKMTTSRKIVFFEQLPLPDSQQQFCGDAYLLGYDVNRRELFVRRFYHGLPTSLTELPQFWGSGTEAFRIPIDSVIQMLVSSLFDDVTISLPRLIGSMYCKAEGYVEWLGMEIVILIRWGQWILDFAPVLFEEGEDEVMDVLGALGRALGQWRRAIQRASSDAWRAYDNKLSRTMYSQKLSANEEAVTNLHTLGSKCCFSREFLAGSVARPRGLGFDKVWLGKFRRQQRSTESSIERVGQRLGALFERPPTPPPVESPVSVLPPILAVPGHFSPSAKANAGPHDARSELKSPPKPAILSSAPAPSLFRARSPIWRESDLPACRTFDDSDVLAASLLNNLTAQRPHANYKTRPLVPLKRLVKTPAIAEEDDEVDPLQKLAMDQRDEERLAGLVTGLWKVVVDTPKLDNILTRQKVGDVLKALMEQAGDETSTGSSETMTDAQNSKVEGNGKGSELKPRKAGLNSLLDFIANWF